MIWGLKSGTVVPARRRAGRDQHSRTEGYVMERTESGCQVAETRRRRRTLGRELTGRRAEGLVYISRDTRAFASAIRAYDQTVLVRFDPAATSQA